MKPLVVHIVLLEVQLGCFLVFLPKHLDPHALFFFFSFRLSLGRASHRLFGVCLLDVTLLVSRRETPHLLWLAGGSFTITLPSRTLSAELLCF